MYSRGGMQGIATWTKECPWVARLLNKQHYDPNHTWTSVTVSLNTQTEPHIDIFNLPGSRNLVVPVIQPHHGGEIWVESTGINSSAPSTELHCAGELKSGHLYPLKGPIHIDPKKWHATMPWEGDRLIVVGYTVGGHRQFSQNERRKLKRWGFRIPWKTKTRPEQPRLRPGLSSHQGLVAGSLQQDAQQQLHEQARDAGRAHEEGRDSTIGLDEDPAQSTVDRARGGRDPNDDREGRLQDPESLQDQGDAPGEDGRVPTRVHFEDQLRPASQSPAQALDGDTGTIHGDELCRLREVQSVDIQGDSGACAVLQRLDSGQRPTRPSVTGVSADTLCGTKP